MEENKKEEKSKEMNFEDLAQVTGGAGLRKVKKEKTYAISEDTNTKVTGN